MGFDGVERFSSVASEQVSRKISDGSHEQILNELASISNAGIDAFGVKQISMTMQCLPSNQN